MRSSAEIAIKKPRVQVQQGVVSWRFVNRQVVPITRESVRRWKLMSEDCIELSFCLQDPVPFAIGDVIEDEEFGYFLITEQPAPADYDVATGSYKYKLRFDRDYMTWKSTIFQLTHTVNGKVERVETTWTLTDSLAAHVQELIRNLYCIYSQSSQRTKSTYPYYSNGALRTFCRYCLDGKNVYYFDTTNKAFDLKDTLPLDSRFQGVSTPNTMSSIEYNGSSIMQALNDSICKLYSCEWWIMDGVYLTGDDTSKPAKPILCFGKCEFGEAIDMYMSPKSYDDGTEPDLDYADVNVEQMTPSKNSEDFANRLYVFGSDKNLPDTYRKSLIFTADTQYGSKNFRDSSKNLTRNMMIGLYDDIKITEAEVSLSSFTSSYNTFYINTDWFEVDRSDFKISRLKIKFRAWFDSDVSSHSDSYDADFWVLVQPGDGGMYMWRITGKTVKVLTTHSMIGNTEVYSDTYIELDLTGEDYYGETMPNVSGQFKLQISPTFSNEDFTLTQAYNLGGNAFDIQVITDAPKYHSKIRTLDNNIYDVIVQQIQGYFYITFDRSVPSGFAVGSQYEILPAKLPEYDGVNSMTVPSSWYSALYGDLNSIRLIGEQRLMLPGDYATDHPSYIQDASVGGESPLIIEKVVVFDNIYPRCGLKIVDVQRSANPVNLVVREYSDGSKQYEKGYLYRIALKRMTIDFDGTEKLVDFVFNSNYLLNGQTLEAKFLTPDEEKTYAGDKVEFTEGSHKLAGLTFELNFLSGNVTVNGTTYTNCVFQIAWNDTYGARLPGDELYPMQYDSLILTGWNVKALSEMDVVADAENELLEQGQLYLKAINEVQYTFDCKMMSDWMLAHGLIPIGQKCNVWHGALPADADGHHMKSSRVIAYELKLDYPYDTPNYTIGETETYSWRKRMEEMLNAKEYKSSTSGTINANGSYYGGGGGGQEIEIDDQLSLVSENPVQNKVVTAAINSKANVSGNYNQDFSAKDLNATNLKGGSLLLDGNYASIKKYHNSLATTFEYSLPNKNGTVAMLSDIESGGEGEWYNIKAAKGPTAGKLMTIIENYDEVLEDYSSYRMILLRWRKGGPKPRYNSWHAPFFGNVSGDYNAIAANNRWWAIESRKQVLFGQTGDNFTSVFSLSIRLRNTDDAYVFRNNGKRNMKFGCAIYKKNSDDKWVRISNIAEFELFATGANSYKTSIRQ